MTLEVLTWFADSSEGSDQALATYWHIRGHRCEYNAIMRASVVVVGGIYLSRE